MNAPLALASHLDQLVELGFGTTRRDVEIYLIMRGLDDLLRAGVVRPIHAGSASNLHACSTEQPGANSPPDEPTREDGYSEGRSRPAEGTPSGAETPVDTLLAGWSESRRDAFAAGWHKGASAEDLRMFYGLATFADLEFVVRKLGLFGSPQRQAAIDAKLAAPPPAGKTVWSEERKAAFGVLWRQGLDAEEIGRRMQADHGMKLMSKGYVASTAHALGLSNDPERKRNRADKLAELDAAAVERRLQKSIRLDKQPIAHIATWLRTRDGMESVADASARMTRPLPRVKAPREASAVPAVLPPISGDANDWPLAKRALVLDEFKRGSSWEEIALAATRHGYRMTAGHVIVGVKQLGLRR